MEIGLNRLIDEDLAAHVEESRQFNAASRAAAADQPMPDPATPEGLRQIRERLASTARSGGKAVDRLVEAGGRQVSVRITLPEGGEIRGAFLDIHGGGFYLGSAAWGDDSNARLAESLGVAVVSVDYRLAPEHPWPAAPDDCETAARWLVEHAQSLFGTGKVAIGGASAGANLTVATLLRLRALGLAERFAGAALLYGAYDLSGRSPGGRLIADEFFIQAYAGHVADRTDPDVSPLYGDLAGLPPALLVVGGLDKALDDNLAMAARLSAAGGDVDVRVYPESGPGFISFPTAMAAAAVRDVESWLGDRLAEE
ncbi:alpha/beta hydrolase [Saccharopolyspora sp. NPDC003752]